MDGAEKVADRGLALPDTAARGRTAARLAAAIASTASGLAAAIASTTGRLAAAVAGTASRLAAASTAIGLIAAAVAAATMLRTALLKQALQPAEEVMLLAAAGATARSIAAAVSRPAGRLAATVASTAGGLAAAVASTGVAAGLTTSSTGIAAGLTTRITAAMMAEHPIQELETIRLTTNGDTENQRTEEHHTLHRATSPLLADHLRIFRPVREACHPEVVIHELFHGRPVEPIRDSNDRRLLPPPWLPDGHSDAPGDMWAIGELVKAA